MRCIECGSTNISKERGRNGVTGDYICNDCRNTGPVEEFLVKEKDTPTIPPQKETE